jgi:hypothetical protein
VVRHGVGDLANLKWMEGGGDQICGGMGALSSVIDVIKSNKWVG